MGYNARNDEIRDNVTRMRQDNAVRSLRYAASRQRFQLKVMFGSGPRLQSR
jgi:hypothetical protein